MEFGGLSGASPGPPVLTSRPRPPAPAVVLGPLRQGFCCAQAQHPFGCSDTPWAPSAVSTATILLYRLSGPALPSPPAPFLRRRHPHGRPPQRGALRAAHHLATARGEHP